MIASACYGGQVSVNRCKQWFADMEVSERAINNEEILNCFITSVPFVSWLFIYHTNTVNVNEYLSHVTANI